MDTKAYRYRQEAMKRWILLFIVSLFSLFSLFVLGIYAIAAERYYDESGRYQAQRAILIKKSNRTLINF